VSEALPRAKQVSQRVRQPTEVRRRLLVEAAREVIAQRGLFAVTVRDIAEAGGVSGGTVSYHFTGIEEILGEVLKDEMTSFYAPVLQAAGERSGAVEELRGLVDGFFSEEPRTVQHWHLWFDFWSLSAHDRGYAEWQRTTYRKWREDVIRILTRGHSAGVFVIRDLDQTATEFMVMFDGLALRAYLPGAPVGPLQARADLWGWVEHNLLAPRAPLPPADSPTETTPPTHETGPHQP
jgi:AcrR family transcriptional regulator